MSAVLKLSSPEPRHFWEIPILFEDEHLLVLDKPAGLATTPNPAESSFPALLPLLHAGIAAKKPWATQRAVQFLVEAHRLDAEASGILVLARSREIRAALREQFGSEKPTLQYLVLVAGVPEEPNFDVTAPVAAHPRAAGRLRVDAKGGRRALSHFEVMEQFAGYALLQATPLTHQPGQLRVHLQHVGLPVVGDATSGGAPLRLSQLKPAYRFKRDEEEHPLIGRAALHADRLTVRHPGTGVSLHLTAPWPKDLTVAVKYLRKFAPGLPPATSAR